MLGGNESNSSRLTSSFKASASWYSMIRLPTPMRTGLSKRVTAAETTLKLTSRGPDLCCALVTTVNSRVASNSGPKRELYFCRIVLTSFSKLNIVDPNLARTFGANCDFHDVSQVNSGVVHREVAQWYAYTCQR